MMLQIQALLKQGLPPLEAEVDHVIKYRITDKNRLEHLLSDLLDYTQIDEGLKVFKHLCRYCYPIHPQLTVDYVYIYRDSYDPDYANNSEE